MNNINCLFLLLTVQYFLSFIVSINCVTCSILASTGNAAGGGLGARGGGLGAWGYMAIILILISVGA